MTKEDSGWGWLEPETIDTQPTPDARSAPERRTHHPIRTIGAIAISLAIAAGAAEVAKNTQVVKTRPNHIQVNLFPREVTLTHPIHRDVNPPCPPVSNQEMHKIQRILHQVALPAVTAMARETPSWNDYKDQQGFRQIAQRYAQRLGLTLVDERPFKHQMDENSGDIPAQLAILNRFTNEYGFTVSIYDGEDKGHIIPFMKNEFGHYVFSEGFRYMLDSLRYMPKEEIKQTGLKHLRIVKGFRNPDGRINYQLAAEADGSGLISIELASLMDTEGLETTLFHELEHLDDYRYCGNYNFNNQVDPAYNALNPASFEYGVGGYWRNATVSNYGASNILEDKAEIGRHLLQGVDRKLANSRLWTISQKYALMLARWDKQVPGIAQYLEQISP